MDLIKKLKEFLKNRDYHAFLVYGSWGVGKTYAVNEFLEKSCQNYKIIKLSLFGISNINDLVQHAIINEKSFANQFKKIIRSVAGFTTITTTLKHGFSLNLNTNILANIVNSCLKDKHDKNKKYLFVIDDIERKDNLLTMEQILGFVDHFQYENVKMILIANLDKLNDLDQFKQFKEKVIQDEYCIELPTEDAITSILDKRYHDCFTKNKIQLKNLRTLIKIKNILQSLHYYERKIDLTLVKCIYYCCLNIFEDRLNKKEYEDNLNEKNISDKKNCELLGLKTKQENININNLNNNNNMEEWEYVYENIKLLYLLNEIKENELKNFVKETYKSIKNAKYEYLSKLNVPKRKSPLKIYNRYCFTEIFYSTKPKEKILEILNEIYTLFKSGNEYNLLDLFWKFNETINLLMVNFLHVSNEFEVQNIISKIINDCPEGIANYLFNNFEFISQIDQMPASWDIAFGTNIQKNPNFLKMKSKIVKNYCDIFNEKIPTFMQTIKINLNLNLIEELLNKRIYLLSNVFWIDKSEYFNSLKLDKIMVETLIHIERILQKELDDNKWHYCISIMYCLSYLNKNNFKLEKTFKFLEERTKLNNLVGMRFSMLKKNLIIKKL